MQRTKHARRLLAVVAGLWLPWLMAAPAQAAPADLIVRNGSIYTVQGKSTWAEAFAVRDGRYVAVGSNAEVGKLAGPRTRVIDLHGAMAMPGINDVHSHPLDGAYEDLYACNFPPFSTLEQVLARVADCAARAEPGDWVVGAAWSNTLMAEISTPAALAALDRASAGHPVLLRDESFHNRWANSEAMKRAGITAASVDPAGGIIVKDPASGQPTGLFKEFPAFLALERQVPPRTQARQLAAAQAAGATLNGVGITGVQDAFSSESTLRIWSQLDRGPGLPLHMVASLSTMPGADPAERSGLALADQREQYRGPNLRPDFAKVFLDGVPPARTAEFLQPYLPDAEHGAHFHGKSNYTQAQLVELLAAFDKRGIPVKLHATGDGSVRLALDAIAEVRKRNGMPGARHQIAHASFIADSDLPRFRQLGVSADISPMIWYPTGLGIATAMAIGQERAAHIFPILDLTRAGVLVAGGSDWPAGQPTPNPWLGIEGLVTRRDPSGAIPGALWPEQAVDLATALRIYTLNSAQAMGLGKETGSIEVGKSADFIVLDKNLFKIPAAQVHTATVQQTFFRGRKVFPKD
ncbi:amidohydrolase [Duganella radicis]|uniref:Amidohydrolase family protein n=1 Tax=Duganella radicis TaxID=551988 RepID=A0A6L6PAM3_9BURK|nr:amidohydrolase [Duganella radicis]MTV36038.1 amidohydrolase family protein [Duganella radicis]